MKKILLILFIITVGLIDAYLAKQLLLDPIAKQFAYYKNQSRFSSKKNTQPDVIEEIIKKADKKNIISQKTPQKMNAPTKKVNVTQDSFYTNNMLMALEFTKLREKPDIKSRVIAIVRKGAMVRVIDQKGKHWKKIIYKSGGDVYEGWVDDRFFKPKGSQ